MIAALYVSPHGPYMDMPDVDPWTVERNATQYAGPWPVVAHPPCGAWGRYYQWSHDDGSTGPIAVAQVRRWGGVLEHPRDSKLWNACTLAYPGGFPDAFGGYSIVVNQHDWGHPACKTTWLYIVGCPRQKLPPMPPRLATPVHPLDARRRAGVLERMSKRQRQLTPPAFARWLVAVATSCFD